MTQTEGLWDKLKPEERLKVLKELSRISSTVRETIAMSGGLIELSKKEFNQLSAITAVMVAWAVGKDNSISMELFESNKKKFSVD